MKKKSVFLIVLFAVLLIGFLAFIIYKNYSNSKKDAPYNSTRTSQNIFNNNTSDAEITSPEDVSKQNVSVENNSVENNSTENAPSENKSVENTNSSNNSSEDMKTEIASFTTKIYSKDSDRQNNVTKACSTLNDTTVKNGATFSFTNTIGKTSSAKGYEKANVFQDGKVIEAMGGGLCQVSTTLYNAVLKVKDLKVTERHSHSNSVPYIKSGKDAAVAYGSYDFKFVNNTGKTIKIKASNTKNNITIKIFS